MWPSLGCSVSATSRDPLQGRVQSPRGWGPRVLHVFRKSLSGHSGAEAKGGSRRGHQLWARHSALPRLGTLSLSLSLSSTAFLSIPNTNSYMIVYINFLSYLYINWRNLIREQKKKEKVSLTRKQRDASVDANTNKTSFPPV